MNMENENSEQKTEKLKNEPAFPSKHSNEQFLHSETVYKGLTMRDYFAGQALIGMVNAKGKLNEDANVLAVVAAACYVLADAMLKERSKYE